MARGTVYRYKGRDADPQQIGRELNVKAVLSGRIVRAGDRFRIAVELAGDADRRGSPSAALDHALGAVDLWRGEPTELVSEPWAVPLVEQRRLRFAAVATRAGELLLAHGDADRARALAERALAIDPWLEAAHRLVVAAHRATGDDLAARRALGRYREAIDDLGLGPDEATLIVERLLDSAPPGSSPLRAG